MTSHYVATSHISMIFACIHVRSEDNWRLNTTTEPAGDTVSGAGSGVCGLDQSEQTEYLKYLKRQELKQSVSDGGRIQSCCTG